MASILKQKETLKSLQSRRTKLQVELDGAQKEKQAIQQKIDKAKSKICKLDIEINNYSNDNLVVSEHALLRLLERHYNVPIADAEEKLIETLQSYISFNKSGTFPIGEGLQAVVKNNVVITIKRKK